MKTDYITPANGLLSVLSWFMFRLAGGLAVAMAKPSDPNDPLACYPLAHSLMLSLSPSGWVGVQSEIRLTVELCINSTVGLLGERI